MKSPPRDEDNSYTIYIQKMKLLSYNDSTNPLNKARDAQRILSFLEGIFKSPATGKVFMYLLGRGAATSWLIQVDLELPEATTYRVLKKLRAMGLVTPEWKIPKSKHSRGGPRVRVWALLDSHAEDVGRAARDHQRALSPNYRVAEDFVQHLLTDVIKDEVTYKQILQEARGQLDLSTQRIRDVSEITAVILKEQGIKVWR